MPKNTIQLITSIYWNYDVLKNQPEQTISVNFTCFTESDELLVEDGNTWTVYSVQDDELNTLHPRLWAKYYRTHPFQSLKDLDIPLNYGDIVIRMDWSARLLREDSIERLIEQCPEAFDIVCFEHPERSDIYEEAEYCIENNIPKYKGLPLREQVNCYKHQWHPEWFGLSATGLLIMKYSKEVESMLEQRWDECINWSRQDQLSFDYLVWLLDIEREWLDDNLRHNEYINFLNPHKNDS